MSTQSTRKHVTVNTLREMKASGDKIACLTAYDASCARVLDDNVIDVVLVGDSLGMVVHGDDSTLGVTMEDMLYHTAAVRKGIKHALLMADMPFLSYSSVEMALENAGALMKESGAEMVKLEGGSDQSDIVSALATQGIPVCAHLGLQPQRVHKIGGYRVQGREADAAEFMIEEARLLEEAGADAVLLECVPTELAARITETVKVPVIGIGAGGDTDGQILVLYDILGISAGHIPKFSHNFMRDADDIAGAVKAFTDAVKAGAFPSEAHTFS